jgi:hypothetical protein
VGEVSGEIAGFYIADSGRGKVSDMTRFVGIDEFRLAANVGNGYAIYTVEPLKMWDENIDGVGNAGDSMYADQIVGNGRENRRWRDGEEWIVRAAENDSVFEMRRMG